MVELPKPVRELISFFERLPGIGPKSATRLAFYLINAPLDFSKNFSKAVIEMKTRIKKCRVCFGVSEEDVCPVCGNGKRSQTTICVVERSIDMLAIENLGDYEGVYHILGGVINPLEHVGPDDLELDSLFGRVRSMAGNGHGVEVEIIIATSPTMEGEATA